MANDEQNTVGEYDVTYADDLETFRRLGHTAVDMATDYLIGVRQRPVFQPMTPDERRRLMESDLGDVGLDPERLLSFVHDEVFTHPMGNGHPRFFGWVNSPPALMGVLADFLAAVIDPSCAGGDHAAIYLEHVTLRWLMDLVGFPQEGSAGLLVSGGSMASLTCLAAARHWTMQQLGSDDRVDGVRQERQPLVLYMSAEGHSCVQKAAELLGIGKTYVRVLPTDDEFRFDLAALQAAIQADRAVGYQPFCVASSAGTVNTGAIDPLADLADLCAQERLWLHVDGAYGAFGRLDASVAPFLAGLERADSLALDPHKWLSVPVECGCALVRDGALLRSVFSLVPPYLQVEAGKGFAGLPWFSEYGFQQTRGFRALKVWMTLQAAGRQGLNQRITRHNRLARQLADLIDTAPDLERLAPVTLSVVCFRYAPPTLCDDAAALERLNRALVPYLQSAGDVFLTGTTLHERFALRVCILHDATTEVDLRALLTHVRQAGQAIVTEFVARQHEHLDSPTDDREKEP
ncbi:MAG: pyridoxal-dependent decarboxylase [Ktedonobacterales bacterium]